MNDGIGPCFWVCCSEFLGTLNEFCLTIFFCPKNSSRKKRKDDDLEWVGDSFIQRNYSLGYRNNKGVQNEYEPYEANASSVPSNLPRPYIPADNRQFKVSPETRQRKHFQNIPDHRKVQKNNYNSQNHQQLQHQHQHQQQRRYSLDSQLKQEKQSSHLNASSRNQYQTHLNHHQQQQQQLQQQQRGLRGSVPLVSLNRFNLLSAEVSQSSNSTQPEISWQAMNILHPSESSTSVMADTYHHPLPQQNQYHQQQQQQYHQQQQQYHHQQYHQQQQPQEHIHLVIPSSSHSHLQHYHPQATSTPSSASSASSYINRLDLPLVSSQDIQRMEMIGGGAFGQVWKAIWRGTPVAMKVLSNACQASTLPNKIVQSFEEEVAMLTRLRHPNICLLLGVCMEPSHRAIITELVSRGSLWDALRQSHFQQPQVSSGSSSSVSSSVSVSGGGGNGNGHPNGFHWPIWVIRRVLEGAGRGLIYLHSNTPPIIHRGKSVIISFDYYYYY
jgi:hypothetical protein